MLPVPKPMTCTLIRDGSALRAAVWRWRMTSWAAFAAVEAAALAEVSADVLIAATTLMLPDTRMPASFRRALHRMRYRP
jgi:hypothetical protein